MCVSDASRFKLATDISRSSIEIEKVVEWLRGRWVTRKAWGIDWKILKLIFESWV